jgi:hypothetical protein
MLALTVAQGGVFGLMSMFAYPGLGDANGGPKHTYFSNMHITCSTLPCSALGIRGATSYCTLVCVCVCVSVGVCVCVCLHVVCCRPGLPRLAGCSSSSIVASDN